MKKLIIVGAGGMGRKVFVCLRRLNEINKKWDIKGFIDDNLNALEDKKCDLKIIGKISEWVPKEEEVFVMGISEPSVKKKVAEMLTKREQNLKR